MHASAMLAAKTTDLSANKELLYLSILFFFFANLYLSVFSGCMENNRACYSKLAEFFLNYRLPGNAVCFSTKKSCSISKKK